MTKKREASELKTKIIKINPFSLSLLFTTGNKFEVTKGINESTNLVGAGYDPSTNCFFLQLQNDSFDETPIGDVLPNHTIEFKKLEDENVPEST